MSSEPIDWASTLLVILLEAEPVLTAELALAAPEKGAADIACTLDSLSSNLSIPLF